MVQLTAGSCHSLYNADPGNDKLFDIPHTLQVLSIKKVNVPGAAGNAVERYRIIVSDGISFMQAMLATQLNSMVNDNSIGKHTVIVVDKLTCNLVQGKRLIILLALHPVETPQDKIGDPKSLMDQDHGTTSATSADAAHAQHSSATSSTSQPPLDNAPQRQQASAKGGRPIFPIEGLSPYQNNWTIKARVTQKSEIKTWSNQRGEGKLFNVTLMDDTGEIRGTGFNLVVDELYPKLEEGKVYYISKARVNLAKKKFSNLTNDYELSFERSTEVEECHETSNLPMIKYNFVQLSELENLTKDSTCDVIAIVKDVAPLSEITSKAQNKTIPKRELTLVDKSGYSVRLTLWGKQAEQYHCEGFPVIAFKGVKVGDFGGRSLSMFSSSVMSIEPDIPECFALRGWYDADGANQPFQAHSSSGGGGAMGGFNRAELRCIQDVKEAQLGHADKVDYFSTRATIMHIKSDNISYPACQTPACNKKVVEDNGSWRCEKCEKSFPSPDHRYIVSLAVADWSGQAWLQGFNDVGLIVFGMPANELVEIKERDDVKYNVILHKNCTTYNFSCRAKLDEYNGQSRTRYGISRINPLDYKEEAMALRDLLHSAWAQ